MEPKRCDHPACGAWTFEAYCPDHAPSEALPVPVRGAKGSLLNPELARGIPAIFAGTVRAAPRWHPSQRPRSTNPRKQRAAAPVTVTVRETIGAAESYTTRLAQFGAVGVGE